MIKLYSESKEKEFSYFPLPDSNFADVYICLNEQEVVDEEGNKQFSYDSNYFRTETSKEIIEKDLNFYLNFNPESDEDYPLTLEQLEAELSETQIALCDIYEQLLGGEE